MSEAGAWVVYVRRSYKDAGSADVSDEQQEAAARAMVPVGSPVTVICDSGGHQSGASADRQGYQKLLSLVACGTVAGIAVYDLSRLARNASLMLRCGMSWRSVRFQFDLPRCRIRSGTALLVDSCSDNCVWLRSINATWIQNE